MSTGRRRTADHRGLDVNRVRSHLGRIRRRANRSRCAPTGKIPYPTEDAARTALAKALLRAPAGRHVPQRYYACPHGQHWHLTSIPTWRTA